MNLLSTRINATALLLAIAFGVPPAIAADCDGNGIEDSGETLIRTGDYDFDADADLDDSAALAPNLAGPGEPAPGSADACTKSRPWLVARTQTP